MGQNARERDPAMWANRYGDSKTAKGNGFLGPLQRPDGGVSSEISMGFTIDGQQVEVPLIVPTLTAAELHHLLTMDVERDPMPQSIQDKAVTFARQRRQAGKPYFADPSEQNLQAMPELPRMQVLPPAASFLNPSHGTGALPMDSPDFQKALQYLAQRIGR